MASKREQVLEAVLALVTAALPNASVKRNAAKPSSLPPGGAVFIRDGDPGEPDVDLNPLTYYYTHKIPLEVAGFPGTDPQTAIDAMLTAIGAACENNRTLGGLAEWTEPEAAVLADLETTGSAAGLWADAAIVVTYATTNPLN